MSSFNNGTCLRCRRPLLALSIEGRLSPFCSECEKLINAKASESLGKRGKAVKHKKLIFAKVPDGVIL